MESESLGTPVLASRIGGIPELVKDGISGELFTPASVNELTNKIALLWADDDKASKYRNGCSNICFDTSKQYCKKIAEIYRGRRT